jgi:hypothetical protein
MRDTVAVAPAITCGTKPQKYGHPSDKPGICGRNFTQAVQQRRATASRKATIPSNGGAESDEP